MSRLAAFLPFVSAFSASAHDGHGATPAHVHVEGLPLDVGLIALTLAAMAPLVVRAWRARGTR